MIKRGLVRGPHRSPRAPLPGALCGCQGTRMESYHLEGLEWFLIADTEGHLSPHVLVQGRSIEETLRVAKK